MKRLSRKYLEWTGWEIVGEFPDEPKLVAIGHPHTSNWDFFIFLAILDHFSLKVRFLAKNGLFKGPFGTMLRKLGGIPVDRPNAGSVVETAVASFADTDSMILVIAPEGTRGATDGWKSGFWRIAEAADVPVLFAFIDGKTKTAGLGPCVRINGDIDSFMDTARSFYENKTGLKPQNVSPVALR